MASLDWSSAEVLHGLECVQIDPTTRQAVGTLDLVPSGCSVTDDYYTDTRCSARLKVDDWGAYVPGAWLRVVHTAELGGYKGLDLTSWDFDARTVEQLRAFQADHGLAADGIATGDAVFALTH